MTLNDYINRISTLPISSENLLLTVFREIRFPKGYCILQEHSKAYKAYVIKEGIAHAFAMKNGKSATFWIGCEGDVIYPGQSLHFHSGEYAAAHHTSVSMTRHQSEAHATLGVSAHGYIKGWIIAEAKNLLDITELTINQISDTLGFDTTNYFIRFFKKQTGLTPGDYRNIER